MSQVLVGSEVRGATARSGDAGSAARRRAALVWSSCVMLAGCAGSTAAGDLARVRQLSGLDLPAPVARTPVSLEPSSEAEQLLKTPLDAERAVQIALLNSRDLRASLRGLGVARGELRQAALLPNPTVEAELLPERNSHLELRLEYSISQALLTPLRTRVAEPGLQRARCQAASAALLLAYEVRSNFYDAQAALQSLALAQAELDAEAAARDASRALSDAGNLAELGLARAEASYERARLRVAELELEVAVSREQLQRLLGLHGAQTTWQVVGPLPPAEDVELVPGLESQVVAANLELRALEWKLQEYSQAGRLARAEGWLPEVAVDVHGLRGDPSESATPTSERWRLGAGVSMAVPLFDRNQGRADAADASFDAAVEQYQALAVTVRSEAREFESRLRATLAKVHHYDRAILPAEQRVQEQAQAQYNAMQINVFELLKVKKQRLEQQMAAVQSLRDYWKARAALQSLLAGQRIRPAPLLSSSPSADEAAAGGH